VPNLWTENGTLLVMYPIALNGSNIPILGLWRERERERERERVLKSEGRYGLIGCASGAGARFLWHR
jgi:hypothetical protein